MSGDAYSKQLVAGAAAAGALAALSYALYSSDAGKQLYSLLTAPQAGSNAPAKAGSAAGSEAARAGALASADAVKGAAAAAAVPCDDDKPGLNDQGPAINREAILASSEAADDALPPPSTNGVALQQQQQQQQPDMKRPDWQQRLKPPDSSGRGPRARLQGASSAPAAAPASNSSSSSGHETAGPSVDQGLLQQQQQQPPALVAKPCSPPVMALARVLERSLSGASSSSTPVTPLSSSGSGFISPRTSNSGGGSTLHTRRSFNTTKQQPSLDSTIASVSVARSLQEQYRTELGSDAVVEQAVLPSLPAACARLVVQHCRQLHGASGDAVETTALNISCATGGNCFELALSFSHVLGIDSSAKHVVAAREMQEKGRLVYHPVAEQQLEAGMIDSSNGGVQQDVTCVAVLPAEVDRERVRFWRYSLPDLPPKMQPVDGVLVEDVRLRLGAAGLQRVLAQTPLLLKPGGTCVVVLPGGHDELMADVHSWLQDAGLVFDAEQQLVYPVVGCSNGNRRPAVASVWLLPTL